MMSEVVTPEKSKPDAGEIVMQAVDVQCIFGRGRRKVAALRGVSVDVRQGECLALVGASGSGKSTLSRMLLGLDAPTSGTVRYRGLTVSGHRSEGYKALRHKSGLVFQNPFASLDPRWTVGRSVAEPLNLARGVMNRGDVEEKVRHALDTVGLESETFVDRYPTDLSGGQAQRAAIARAIVADPDVVVADEPMSALDVASRVQILDSFAVIRAANPGMAMVIVSHDLGVVQHLADRVVVLRDGRVEEAGTTGSVLMSPRSDYTKALIEAAS